MTYIPFSQRDLTKLPKWAQNEIGRLQRNLEYAEKKLSAGPEDSKVFADAYGDNPRPLGNPTIAFCPEGDRLEAFRVKLQDDGCLEVSGGWKGIRVIPMASNVVLVGQGR